MLQFVLLLHECPSAVPRATHWDLMLEVGAALRTWVLYELPWAWAEAGEQVPPAGSSGDAVHLTAEEIQPHRLAYLTLEGPLSGDRGSVQRIDRGPYEPIEVGDRLVRVRLSGERICGLLEMTRPDASLPYWRLSYSGPAEAG